MSATIDRPIDRGTAVRRTEFAQIPLSRVVRVELRKMFDTRSGFWLIASIAITSLLAATVMSELMSLLASERRKNLLSRSAT